jgi:tRNA pseudouridine55 synthase
VASAHTLEELDASFEIVPIAAAARAAFPSRDVDSQAAHVVAHGGRLPWESADAGPVAVFGPEGAFLALVEESGGLAKPLAVFV